MKLSKKTKNNLKGILFDLDGTLIDSMHDHFYAWRKTFDHFFQVKINPEDFFILEGMKLQKIIFHFCKLNKINPNDINLKKILKFKENVYLKKTSFKLYPYVNKCIKNLKNDNIKLGIVTSGLRERLINSVPNVFLNNFEVIITGEDSKYGKPSKQPFSSGLKKLNLLSNECIAVENAPLGIISAKKSNLFCIAISSTLDKKYLNYADIRLSSFKDFFLMLY